MKKYIRIEKGGYRNHDMSGRIFPIVKDYQDHSNKPGGFVTVDTTQLAGFEGLEKVRINVPTLSSIQIVTQGEWIEHKDKLKLSETPNQADVETDEQAIERIASRFAILDEMAEAVSEQKVRAMIVFKKLYEHAGAGHVVCFDDCDAILYDDLALNLLKAALDTGKTRKLHWNTESSALRNEGIPNHFEFNGGIIFITNVKFDNVKSKKLQDHLSALQSRCHYLDLTIDSMRDRMLRIKQICRQGMLDKYAMGKEKEQELIQFIYDNKHKLREISLRMVLKIADLWKMAPEKYQQLAINTCMRPGA